MEHFKTIVWPLKHESDNKRLDLFRPFFSTRCLVHPCLQQVVDDMGNVKFSLDTGPDANSNSWLKYVRSAPSFEEQNLAACHLTGDQVSDMTGMSCLDLRSIRHAVAAVGTLDWVCVCVSATEIAKCVCWLWPGNVSFVWLGWDPALLGNGPCREAKE